MMAGDLKISWRTDVLLILGFLFISMALILTFLYVFKVDPFRDVVNVEKMAYKGTQFKPRPPGPRNKSHHFAVLANTIFLAPILMIGASGIAIVYVRRKIKISFLKYIPLLVVSCTPLFFYLWHRHLFHFFGFFADDPDAKTLWGYFKLMDPTIFEYLRCITLAIFMTCLFEVYGYFYKQYRGETD